MNMILDFYYNKDDDHITGKQWLVLTPEQKQKMAFTLCYYFDHREELPTYERQQLLMFINTIVVSGKDFTQDFMEEMNTLTNRRALRNPLRMEMGSEGGYRGNNFTNKNQYRTMIHKVIARKSYEWTYDDMTTNAKAMSKGIPVDEVDFESVVSYKDVENLGAMVDHMNDHYSGLVRKFKTQDDIISGLLKTVEELAQKVEGLIINFGEVIDKQNDRITALEARLADKPKVVVDNTKGEQSEGNKALADRIKERLSKTD